ncbi:hypothetical protein JHK85_009927 [Glycine max]|nr:hypothetical protein JHK85_009927 [Glycine max]
MVEKVKGRKEEVVTLEYTINLTPQAPPQLVFELCIKGVSPCFELSYNLLVDRWRQAKEQRKMDLKNIRGGGSTCNDTQYLQNFILKETLKAKSPVYWELSSQLLLIGGGPNDMRRQIMVISHTFTPFRHSRVQWHAVTNIVFCAFCHPEAADPMTCRYKLWSFCTLRHSDIVVSDGTQGLTLSSTPFVIQRRQAR